MHLRYARSAYARFHNNNNSKAGAVHPVLDPFFFLMNRGYLYFNECLDKRRSYLCTYNEPFDALRKWGLRRECCLLFLLLLFTVLLCCSFDGKKMTKRFYAYCLFPFPPPSTHSFFFFLHGACHFNYASTFFFSPFSFLPLVSFCHPRTKNHSHFRIEEEGEEKKKKRAHTHILIR